MNPDKVKFTKHALERGREMGLSEKKMRNLITGTKRLKKRFWREAYKFFKYGPRQGDVVYYYRKESTKYPPLLFTIDESEPPTVITVTVKKGKV